MKIYICTKKGAKKLMSDDRVLVGKSILSEIAVEMDIPYGAIAVADGVGGNAAGDVAAVMVCEAASHMTLPETDRFQAINAEILERGQKENYKGMASTLSGIYWTEEKNATLFHVGNTRVYAIQGSGYLNQLTKDDTVEQYLLETGKLTEEEAETYSARNEITACFGGGDAKLLNMKIAPLKDENACRFLMTSDGVHEALSVDEMEDCISGYMGNWMELVKTLVSRAQEKGTQDDCTAVFVDKEG